QSSFDSPDFRHEAASHTSQDGTQWLLPSAASNRQSSCCESGPVAHRQQGGSLVPQHRKTIGTGMTARAVVTFDIGDRGDVEALVDAAIASFDRTSFQRLSRRISDL